MTGYYTIYENAKGDRYFYMGDRRMDKWQPSNVRLLGVGLIKGFPVQYPIELTTGELLYDDFPSFEPVVPEEWPSIPVHPRFDWDMSLSQIDCKFGGSTGVVRKKGVKIRSGNHFKDDRGFKNAYPHRLNEPSPNGVKKPPEYMSGDRPPLFKCEMDLYSKRNLLNKWNAESEPDFHEKDV